MIRKDLDLVPLFDGQTSSCWKRACVETGLADVVPEAMMLVARSATMETFCYEHDISLEWYSKHIGDDKWRTKKWWPRWEDLPITNIVLMTGGKGKDGKNHAHAEAIASKTEYARLKRKYPGCCGVIDVEAALSDNYADQLESAFKGD